MRFLLLDRLLQVEQGKSLAAAKCVALSEDYFADHFPGFPVMPGSLILEGFEQASHLLVGISSDFTRAAALRRVTRGSFRRFVRPGDRLVFRVSLTRFTETEARVQADATSDGRKMADAHLEFDLLDARHDPEARERCRQVEGFYRLLMVDPLELAGENWGQRVGSG